MSIIYFYFVSCVITSLISTFFFTGTVEKKITKDGKDRKWRMADKPFHKRKLAKLIMRLYSSVFPLLKSFVILFEMKEPLIHLLHKEQVRLFKEFLVCFIKPDVVMGAKSSSRLTKLDISSQSN